MTSSEYGDMKFPWTTGKNIKSYNHSEKQPQLFLVSVTITTPIIQQSHPVYTSPKVLQTRTYTSVPKRDMGGTGLQVVEGVEGMGSSLDSRQLTQSGCDHAQRDVYSARKSHRTANLVLSEESKKWGSGNRRRKKTKMKNQRKRKISMHEDILHHTHTKLDTTSVYSHKGIINYGTSTK